MAKKQLPLSSKASYNKGIWMVFNSDKYIIRVWLSMLTGKEIIYVNEEVVSQRRNISSFNTIDSFDHRGDHFDVEIDTESLAPIKINCSVFVNGAFIGCQQALQNQSGVMSVREDSNVTSIQRMMERYINFGKQELAEYDLDSALLHFDKALIIDDKSSEIYYFKACISSLNEDEDQVYKFLNKAISLGLNGKTRILEDDHFAYVRVLKSFEDFRKKHDF